jgi:hypothetical protein
MAGSLRQLDDGAKRSRRDDAIPIGFAGWRMASENSGHSRQKKDHLVMANTSYPLGIQRLLTGATISACLLPSTYTTTSGSGSSRMPKRS